VIFAVQRLFTKTFWLVVITTFFAVLMSQQRDAFKDIIFQEAIAGLKKQCWPDFRPKDPFA
jgi:hypothetical protein